MMDWGWGWEALSPLALSPLPWYHLALCPACSQVHNLEQKLLNATFNDDKLNLSTNNIHSLVFKLGCNFTGLSLSSAALEKVPQVRDQGMGWQCCPKSCGNLKSRLSWASVSCPQPRLLPD